MKIFMFFKDGGVLITYPIAILLIVIIFLWVKAIRKEGYDEKTVLMIASIGWFVLALGYLGRTIGLIGAFDKVAAAGDISPRLLADGLKMALLGPLFGLFTFLVARAGIFILILKKKNKA